MACLHEEIRCTNCVKYCLKCGAELPSDFIPGKHIDPPVEAAETPVKAEKTAKRKTTKKVVK